MRGPAVNLVSVSVTTDGPVQSPLVSGSTVALANTRIDLLFDRYLDPRSVLRQSVCLRSDSVIPTAAEECTGGVFLNPVYNPASRTVSYFIDPGNASPILPAAVHYLTVYRGTGDELGFRAFDGAPLAQAQAFFFDVTDPGGLQPQVPVVDPTDCLLELGTSCGNCHAAQTPLGEAITPAMGLELNPTDRFLATSLRPAHGMSIGSTGNDPLARRPDRFGAGMPVIAPGDPGNSYLLYKMLAREDPAPATLAPGETDRLRAFITGAPMPPSNQLPDTRPRDEGGNPIDLQLYDNINKFIRCIGQ